MAVSAGARPSLGDQHLRQAIKKLPHSWRQHLLETRERQCQIALKGGAGNRLEHVPAQVERADLGEREARLEPLQCLPLETPVRAPVLVALVVQRKSRLLQRREVTADRAGGYLEIVGKGIDRGSMTRRFERVEHLPLPDDFLIPRHRQLIVVPKK